MEGVGARLGRSSTRYTPTTVFNRPVRKWKKRWVHLAPPSSAVHLAPPSSASRTNQPQRQSQSQHHGENGTINGNNGSHILLYKWTPITQSQNAAVNGNSNTKGYVNGNKDETAEASPEEPPRKKFKYIPIAVLDEQKIEATEVGTVEEDEANPSITDISAKIADEKLDINDVPVEESQDNNQVVHQDLNESSLDLGLNFKDMKKAMTAAKRGASHSASTSKISPSKFPKKEDLKLLHALKTFS